ncbi:AAA family ATPase [Thermanaerosceptrum fracticalcis]|uniref:DNA 3'-5' helicase n=2 Tax=Thermanaerosceptrum fracticalcis TaxID=1712410 RepID=A0A7G6E6R0_THEFR|nr:AAA family ATPase [Thermanaerosceptrum fracticalcis]
MLLLKRRTPLMKKLTPEQEAFLEAEGKIVLCACPGSGKTFIVARKLLKYVENWEYAHRGVAVLSFTNVASQEIDKQTKELMPEGYRIEYPHFIGTIDSFIDSFILLRFGYLMQEGSRKRPVILHENYGEIRFYTKNKECHARGCISNPFEFHWSSDGKLLRNGKKVDCSITTKKPCVAFKQAMIKKGFVTQNEATALSYRLLKKYPQIVDAIVRRFPIVMIDEAQDTSKEQMEIIDLLTDAGVKTIILVGDPDQSIYEWRNATPEFFIAKVKDDNWKTMWLTSNFRSSQLICNATQVFSHSLASRQPSKAEGEFALYQQKPILLNYSNQTDKSDIINKFKELCQENGIEWTPSKVAVLTRGKIHKGIDIDGLWKSPEVESLAKASYEWYKGSRRKAFSLCEKVLYSLTIGDIGDIKHEIRQVIENIMPYENWRKHVVKLLVSLPDPNIKLSDWVKSMLSTITNIIQSAEDIYLIPAISLQDKIKIKLRDTKNPGFQSIPLRNYIEKRDENDITLSSVHGVKGETYDAIMLIIEGIKGNTLTPTMIDTAPLDSELIRIAYVAMTRPRKLLVVALPVMKNKKSFKRLPLDKWIYTQI